MDLNECIDIMYEKGCTCVVADDEGNIFTSRKKGIRPMLDLMAHCEADNWKPVYQADMIIGKAAVLISEHCGIRNLYADVASESAVRIAAERGLDLSFREIVPRILNQQKTGEGPFEAVLNGTDLSDFDLVMKKIRGVAEDLGQL